MFRYIFGMYYDKLNVYNLTLKRITQMRLFICARDKIVKSFKHQ